MWSQQAEWHPRNHLMVQLVGKRRSYSKAMKLTFGQQNVVMSGHSVAYAIKYFLILGNLRKGLNSVNRSSHARSRSTSTVQIIKLSLSFLQAVKYPNDQRQGLIATGSMIRCGAF